MSRLLRVVPATELALGTVALAMLATSLLPSTAATRAGVILCAAVVIVGGLLWFHVLPRGLFGPARFIAGSTATVALGALLLALTGGAASPYFPIYLLSVLGSVFAIRPRSTLVTGAGAMLAWVLIVIGDAGDARLTPETLDRASIGLVALGGVTILGALVTQSLRRSNDLLANLALTDPLTGVLNRAVFEDELSRLHALAQRNGRVFSVLAIDVDNLKRINDGGGHEAGDRALVAAAQAIRAAIRLSDIPIRTGGDEFVVLLPDTPVAAAPIVAARLKANLDAVPGNPTLSVGAAGWRPGRSAEDVVRAADAALYRAKELGRDRAVLELPQPA